MMLSLTGIPPFGGFFGKYYLFTAAIRSGLTVYAVLGMGFMAHHLIEFTREALRGEQNASYYSTRVRERAPARSRRSAAAQREPV